MYSALDQDNQTIYMNVEDYAPTLYGETDVIGVFVNLPLQRARFRKNGEWIRDWFYGVVGQLYPAVSFFVRTDTAAKVKVNFGRGRDGRTTAFKYPPKEEDWDDTTPEVGKQEKAEKVEEGGKTKERDTEEKEDSEEEGFTEFGEEEEEHSAGEETGSEEE